jgi:hypothetical protein
MGVFLLILSVMGSWQVWLSAVLLLMLFSLVSQLTAFEKRQRVVYYQPPAEAAKGQDVSKKPKK